MLRREQLMQLAEALGGLPVLGCHPGSPAARIGIRYGDVVLAVNDIATPDWIAYATARKTAKAGCGSRSFARASR